MLPKHCLKIPSFQAPSVFKSSQEQAFLTSHELFNFYNSYFFQDGLAKCVVKWSTRMTRCAGTCAYQGFGSSTITLSEPLLKYRSFNELKQTLLHEMIHAHLFMTDPEACKTEGGHGPAFQSIMHQINSVTGLRITVYHSFHEEVRLYQKHVWRCQGRCRDQAPFFGYVKRAMNRPPQKADHWFKRHEEECGGTFVKISEPEGYKAGSRNDSSRSSSGQPGADRKASKKTKKQEKGIKIGGGEANKNRSIKDFLRKSENSSKGNNNKTRSPQNKQNPSIKAGGSFSAFSGSGITIGSFVNPTSKYVYQQDQ